MGALDEIRTDIPEFPGCEGEEECRRSDEQVRSYVGERLAALPTDQLSQQDASLYENALLRCEFFNQEAFKVFDEDRTEERINAVLDADAALIAAAKKLDPSAPPGDALKAVNDAFDRRDAAMMQK